MEIRDEKLQNKPDELRAAFAGHAFRRLLPLRAIRAAVLMPLVERDGAWNILFEVRASKIVQGGEICFPGGRIEEDETPLAAVVRETTEELGISADTIEVLAPMFKMIGPGGADIHSYVGILHDYQGSYDEAEVASVFEIPVKTLLAMEPKSSRTKFKQQPAEDFHFELIPKGKDYPWASIHREYHFYETEFGVIWGMTGELLRNLLEELRAAGIC